MEFVPSFTVRCSLILPRKVDDLTRIGHAPALAQEYSHATV